MIASSKTEASRMLAFLTIAALCACNGSFGERVRETVHQAMAAGAMPAVRVDNVAGEVRVEGWRKPIVDVEATKYGYDGKELRDISIAVQREEGGVAIVTSYTGAVHGGGVRYRIAVPQGASLRIHNVAGAVDVAGVAGNLEVETQAGEITADAGRVAQDRSIDLHATTGAVTLWIAPDSSAKVDAYSTVGAFASDIPGISESRENIVGSRASGTIGSGSAQIRLGTTTGAIALRKRE
jgi:hypothetical protein